MQATKIVLPTLNSYVNNEDISFMGFQRLSQIIMCDSAEQRNSFLERRSA